MKKLFLLLLCVICAFAPQAGSLAGDDGLKNDEKLIIALYDFSANAYKLRENAETANEKLLYSNAEKLDKYRIRRILSYAESSGTSALAEGALSDVKNIFDKRVTLRLEALTPELNRIYDNISSECCYEICEIIKFSPDKEIITPLLCDGIYEKYTFSEDGKMWIYTDNVCMCFSHDGAPDYILKVPADVTRAGGAPEINPENVQKRALGTGVFEQKRNVCCDVSECAPGQGKRCFDVHSVLGGKSHIIFRFDERLPGAVKIEFIGIEQR